MKAIQTTWVWYTAWPTALAHMAKEIRPAALGFEAAIARHSLFHSARFAHTKQDCRTHDDNTQGHRFQMKRSFKGAGDIREDIARIGFALNLFVVSMSSYFSFFVLSNLPKALLFLRNYYSYHSYYSCSLVNNLRTSNLSRHSPPSLVPCWQSPAPNNSSCSALSSTSRSPT